MSHLPGIDSPPCFAFEVLVLILECFASTSFPFFLLSPFVLVIVVVKSNRVLLCIADHVLRALYSDREIVLLDDVLSSVDSHVANSIFAHLVDPAFRGKRTFIFATNNREFCRKADRIVVLDKGGVVGISHFTTFRFSS